MLLGSSFVVSDFDQPKVHPLLVREIRPPRNWFEWRQCWEASTTTHQLAGLLHGGFNVGFGRYEYGEQEYNYIDRLETYFAVADGWAEGYYQLQSEEDEDKDKEYFVGYDKHGNPQQNELWELRQQLARKAFDMLTHNFFKPEVEDAHRARRRGESFWGREILSGRLLPIILDFFRIEMGSGGSIRNLSGREEPPRDQQHAVGFLLELIKVIFRWEEKKIESWTPKPDEVAKRNVETRERVESAKLWAIEVLACLYKLDLLWDIYGVQSSAWGKFVELEEPCVAKLREIALRTKLDECFTRVSKTRPVDTLEEACYAGSRVAWFLKKYELAKAEHERLSAIQKAEWDAQEAEEKERGRLEAIERAEAARVEAERTLRELTITKG